MLTASDFVLAFCVFRLRRSKTNTEQGRIEVFRSHAKAADCSSSSPRTPLRPLVRTHRMAAPPRSLLRIALESSDDSRASKLSQPRATPLKRVSSEIERSSHRASDTSSDYSEVGSPGLRSLSDANGGGFPATSRVPNTGTAEESELSAVQTAVDDRRLTTPPRPPPRSDDPSAASPPPPPAPMRSSKPNPDPVSSDDQTRVVTSRGSSGALTPVAGGGAPAPTNEAGGRHGRPDMTKASAPPAASQQARAPAQGRVQRSSGGLPVSPAARIRTSSSPPMWTARGQALRGDHALVPPVSPLAAYRSGAGRKVALRDGGANGASHVAAVAATSRAQGEALAVIAREADFDSAIARRLELCATPFFGGNAGVLGGGSRQTLRPRACAHCDIAFFAVTHLADERFCSGECRHSARRNESMMTSNDRQQVEANE